MKYLLASAGSPSCTPASGSRGRAPPTQTGWFADEDIFEMQIERYRPHRPARRYDAGTPPVPNIYAGLAGSG